MSYLPLHILQLVELQALVCIDHLIGVTYPYTDMKQNRAHLYTQF